LYKMSFDRIITEMGTAMAEQAAKLLDFTQRLDINLLDSVVACMYTGMGDQVRIYY